MPFNKMWSVYTNICHRERKDYTQCLRQNINDASDLNLEDICYISKQPYDNCIDKLIHEVQHNQH